MKPVNGDLPLPRFGISFLQTDLKSYVGPVRDGIIKIRFVSDIGHDGIPSRHSKLRGNVFDKLEINPSTYPRQSRLSGKAYHLSNCNLHKGDSSLFPKRQGIPVRARKPSGLRRPTRKPVFSWGCRPGFWDRRRIR